MTMMTSKLIIYNTLTHKSEEFKPITADEVGIYSCGPTVYNYAHIGNFRSYIFSDLLRRTLKLLGYKVKHAMNITDVDDKTIVGAAKQKMALNDFTEKYIEEFHKDLDILGIEKVEFYPRATEHVPEMIEIIRKLEKNGLTYVSEGSVYFSIRKYKEYGKLSGNRIAGDRDGARIDSDEYEKENAKDFVLWKAKKEGEPFWPTPWGDGRPGWHIECSAMSMKYLGETFDIHTGGFDLIFPHHENEIAQSEGATGKPFVHYWMHCSHLIIEGEKMSKSKGNFYTLRDLLDKGYSAKAIRLVLMSTHYRKNLDFTFDKLKAAEQTVKKVQTFYEWIKNFKPVEVIKDGPDLERGIQDVLSGFIEKGLCDDLNISIALAALNELMTISYGAAKSFGITENLKTLLIRTILEIDSIFAILDRNALVGEVIPEEIEALVMKRTEVRKNKDWVASDRLRDEIKSKGWLVEDGKEGMKVKKA